MDKDRDHCILTKKTLPENLKIFFWCIQLDKLDFRQQLMLDRKWYELLPK